MQERLELGKVTGHNSAADYVVSTITQGQKINPHWAVYGASFKDVAGVYRNYITINPSNGETEVEVSLIADLGFDITPEHPVMLDEIANNLDLMAKVLFIGMHVEPDKRNCRTPKILG